MTDLINKTQDEIGSEIYTKINSNNKIHDIGISGYNKSIQVTASERDEKLIDWMKSQNYDLTNTFDKGDKISMLFIHSEDAFKVI